MEEARTPDRAPREFKERHYSVHPTKNGAETMITQKTVYATGAGRQCVAYIHETSDRLLWPIYSFRQFAFAPSSAVFAPDPKHKWGTIADYNQRRDTLIYTLFVASLDFDDQVFKTKGYWSHRVNFERYAVFALVTFLPAPAVDVGRWRWFFTSTPRDDDCDYGERRQVHAKSFRAEEAEKIHRECFGFLAGDMERRILAEAPDAHARFPELDRRLNTMNAEPFE